MVLFMLEKNSVNNSVCPFTEKSNTFLFKVSSMRAFIP